MVVFLSVGGPPAYADSSGRSAVVGFRGNRWGLRVGGFGIRSDIGSAHLAPALLLLLLFLGKVSLASRESVVGFCHGRLCPEG